MEGEENFMADVPGLNHINIAYSSSRQTDIGVGGSHYATSPEPYLIIALLFTSLLTQIGALRGPLVAEPSPFYPRRI